MALVSSRSIGRSWVVACACLVLVACGGGGGGAPDAAVGDASKDALADKGSTGGTQGQDAAADKGTGGVPLGGTGVAGAQGGTTGGAGAGGGKGGSAGAGGETPTGGSATGGLAGGGTAGSGLGGLATGGIAAGGQGGNAGQGGGTTPGCGQEGTPCMVGLKYGLCVANVCTVCSDTVDDAACKTAYGSGRLCIAGSCSAANCRQSADCPSGNVCKNNQCGPCATGTDDALCGAGKLCLAQQCVAANCRSNTDCSGGKLCVGNTCQACTGTGDDAACTTRYGAGQICKAGACAPGCRSSSACTSGKLCVNQTCATCTAGTDDAACAAVYGNTSVCRAGACTTGACTQDPSCGGGTLCQASACAACVDTTDDSRCVARYGAGQLCVAGSCKAANCRSDAGCSSGNLCKSNSCAVCVDTTDDGACAARYGAGNICQGGLCRVGCRDSAACATGQLCGATFMCGGCQDPADDAACASAHGAGTICAQGTCANGCRLDAQCSQGTLCKGESCGACVNVTDDGACATRYGAGTLCNGGQCVAGCRSAQSCVGADAGKLCTSLACTACAQSPSGDSDCTAAYALQSVCAGGACVPGNCRTSSDCAGSNAGYRCVANQCTPCANDSSCQGDSAYGPGFICHVAATDAAGKKGQCVSNTCTTPRSSCSANPNVDFCCASTGGNSCLTGNCCVTGDCAFGQICTNHQCTQCNTVNDGNYFVDPVNGSDSAGVTGSTTCAWKTVTFALASLASSSAAATINIKATGDVGTVSGETLPLGISTVLPNAGGTLRIVPANRTIRGAGTDTPTIKLTANQVAFFLATPNSHLSQLVIDSVDTAQANRGSFGIRVFQGSAVSTSIDHVTVRNTQGAGIRVERSNTSQTTSGILTIGPGVTVTAAGTAACGGLHVLATGVAHITGGTGSDVTQFVNNNGYGICVAERAQIDILGTPVYPVPSGTAEGTVVIKGNTSGGISVAQCIADPALYVPINGGPTPPPAFTQGNCAATLPGLSGPPPLNILNGVAIWSHGTGTANGLYVTAGASVRLRNSVILGNARAGVRVDNGPSYTSGANSYRVFDLSAVDLGTAADPGRNVLQVPWGAGAPLNGGAGVQVNISAAQGQTLVARGNTFQDDATSSMSLDCRTSTAAISRNYPITTCFTTSTKGISVCGSLVPATNANQLDVANCKIP